MDPDLPDSLKIKCIAIKHNDQNNIMMGINASIFET